MSLLNLVGAASKTVEQANVLTTFTLLVFMLFNGFYLNTANVGAYFRWIKHINFLYYSTRAATVNDFSGLVFECTEEEAESHRGSRVQAVLAAMDGASIAAEVA